ncbi:RCC1 domain-containing protein [Chitinophagaceae bacterium MMS25-I14]
MFRCLIMPAMLAFGLTGCSAQQGGTGKKQSTDTNRSSSAFCWRSIGMGGGSGETNFFRAAIAPDGTLWTWGHNEWGQLGNGSAHNNDSSLLNGSDAERSKLVEDIHKPKQVSADTGWESLAAGAFHVVAIKKDGSLWAWGNNFEVGLGDGSGAAHYSPVRIGTDNDWKMVAAGGGNHMLAIKNDGSLWAWGSNNYGELGDGTHSSRNIPIRIGHDTDWRFTSVDADQSWAVKSNGTLYKWGARFSNDYETRENGHPENEKNVPVIFGHLDLGKEQITAADNPFSVCVDADALTARIEQKYSEKIDRVMLLDGQCKVILDRKNNPGTIDVSSLQGKECMLLVWAGGKVFQNRFVTENNYFR